MLLGRRLMGFRWCLMRFDGCFPHVEVQVGPWQVDRILLKHTLNMLVELGVQGKNVGGSSRHRLEVLNLDFN